MVTTRMYTTYTYPRDTSFCFSILQSSVRCPSINFNYRRADRSSPYSCASSAMSSYNNNIRKSRPSSSSSSSYARPRSVYSSPSRSGSMYSSLGLSTPYLNTSSYSPSIPSYSSTSTYGGTASGYGGLTITPSSSSSPNFSSYRSASPSSRQSLATPLSSRQSHVTPSSSRQSHVSISPSSRQSHTPLSSSSRQSHTPLSSSRQSHTPLSSSRQSHAPLKRNYYQSPLSRFDSSTSLASNKSYGSEGYAVSHNQRDNDYWCHYYNNKCNYMSGLVSL